MLFTKFIKAWPWFVPAAFVFFICAVPAQAQTMTGNIIGAVRDSSGAVMVGVKATLTSPQLPGGPRNSVTNERGEYRFSRLEPGVYSLKVEFPGFNTYEETGLRVLTAGTTERLVTLNVATTVTAITVSGESPVIDLYRTGIQNAITVEELEVVSTPRYGVQAYMTMLPGVTTNNYSRSIHLTVMGSATNETTVMSDGLSINSISGGTGFFLGDFDGAQEVNATTLGASAEYQAASGGVLQLISKSGTNNFHGDFSAYWSPDMLASKPVKLPCALCADGRETGVKWYNNRDISAHVGGPILSNRLWFFTGIIYRGQSATQPGQPEPADNERFMEHLVDTNTKVTGKINDRLQFQQTFYAEYWDTVTNGTGSFTTPTRPIETLQRRRGNLALDGNYGTAVDWTINSRSIFTARYNLSQGGSNRIGFFEDLITPNRRDQLTGVQSGNTGASRFRPRRDEVNLKVNTLLFGSRSRHNVFYGVQISRSKNVSVSIQPGGVTYYDYAGAPDYAVFVGPDVQAATSRAFGVWAENEMTIGRLTVKYGGRYDHMTSSSQDAPEFDGQFNEVGTIKGLGKLVTWNTFSPRLGVAVKLTSDGRTVMRAVAGRFYLPLYLDEFQSLHPGRAITTRMSYDPKTGDYTTFVSRTDPRTQTKIDLDMRPPYTDQFSFGMEREIARDFAVGFNLVYKRSGDQLGYKVLNAEYGEQQVTLDNGQTLTVFPLLSNSSDRVFLRTNGEGFYSDYRAFILTVTKRFSSGWQLTTGYTRQRAKGLEVSGQDPNDFINADGGLGNRDKPHMLSVLGSYDIPKINVQISGNMTAVSGMSISSTARVSLPQGARSVNLEPAGSKYRTASEKFLSMRITKNLLRRDSVRVELAGEIKNVLQEKGGPDLQSTVYNSPNFLVQDSYPDPRQLRLLIRLFY